jgi:DNA-binding NarL/FixJ family response regulator
VKRARRAPRQPVYGRARKPKTSAVKSESNAQPHARYRPSSVNETIELLSRHPQWTDIKAKFGARLRAAGVPEQAIREVTGSSIIRILEALRRGKGIGFENTKWMLTWEIVTSRVFGSLPENKKLRLKLFFERLAAMGLNPRHRTTAFYVVWGLGNKRIGEILHCTVDNAKERVINLRRKLGIPEAGLDDRVTLVCILLGLHDERKADLLANRLQSADLTDRERTIARCMIEDLGYKRIAEQIGRSQSAVKRAAESLRRKLGIPPTGVDDRVRNVLTLLGV